MKTWRSLAIPVTLLALAGCAPSVAVNHDYDTEADFAALHTFRWLTQPAAPTRRLRANPTDNSLLDARIKRAVNAQLGAKGYTEASGPPDFLVAYHVGAQNRVEVTDWGYGYGRFGRLGGGVTVDRYKEGTLILDVIHGQSKQLIWRGSAQGIVDPGASTQEREARMNDAVAKMLMHFPPSAQ